MEVCLLKDLKSDLRSFKTDLYKVETTFAAAMSVTALMPLLRRERRRWRRWQTEQIEAHGSAGTDTTQAARMYLWGQSHRLQGLLGHTFDRRDAGHEGDSLQPMMWTRRTTEQSRPAVRTRSLIPAAEIIVFEFYLLLLLTI